MTFSNPAEKQVPNVIEAAQVDAAGNHYLKSEHIVISSGVADAGLPVELDASGVLDASVIPFGTIQSDITELFLTRDIEAQILTRQYEVNEIFRHTDGKNYRTDVVSPAGQTPTTNPANFSLVNTDSDIFIAQAGRSAAGVTNQYLKSNDIFTNITPITLPFDCTLIAISAATNGVETWDAEIHIGLALVTGAKVSIVAADSGIATMSIDFNAGDKIQMFCNGTVISNPAEHAVFRRR